MPHWIKLSSVQPLTKGKLHPWLLLQLPKREEHPKEFLFSLESFLPEHKAILHPDHLSSCAISDQNSETIGHYRICQCSIYW
jgi:hypothetical protein